MCHSVAHPRPNMHAFGSSQTHTVLLLFASLVCVHKQHHSGFVLRDETLVQNDLLTPDQLFFITHTQSVSKTVCQLYNAWLYLFTQICIII